ncbi:MAG TPA: hypothetical protein VM925_36115 [Labilithrix sp.]|nr:hypothetical protein [Labilithrix sp.]
MRRELRWKRRGLHRLFFFFVLLPMLCVFPYLRVVNNPNEFVRVFTVMSLVESGSFCIDEQVQTFGWVNDMAKVKGKTDGVDHYFMVKAPGLVYLGIPPYVLFSRVVAPLLGHKYPGVHGGHVSAASIPRGTVITQASTEQKLWWLRMSTWAMRIFATQIPCFLFLLWFEKYLRHFAPDPAIRYAAVTAAGLGTNYFAYTQIFASHSQYAAIAFLAFATIEKERRLSRGDVKQMRLSRALLAGFCTSACVTLEYHSLLMTIVLSLFATLTFWSPLRAVFWVASAIRPLRGARRWIPLGTSVNPTRMLAFALGGLINIPHMMYFHWTAYGNPFTPGHHQLETASFATAHHKGLWGIVWPSWDHIKSLSIDPGAGFFSLSPFMWIGLIAAPIVLLWPSGGPGERAHLRIVTVVWIACMTMAFGVNAGFVEWRGGWTVGPRYLVVCAPFFAFGGAVALERVAQRSRLSRLLARGVGGGLAFASVVMIGTVGLVFDTLPEAVARPFAQFFVPMARLGFVPHHIGEWFGWTSTTLWYVTCAAMLLAPLIACLVRQRGETRPETFGRVLTFAFAFAIGMVPALTPPEDSSALFKLHPAIPFLAGWEPPGRDRLTVLREEAERFGTRGIGPCLWYQVADLERVLNHESQAARDEARARSAMPKERCPKQVF